MIDAVLSYHTNPYGCGVAKFNIRLAKELGVPFRHWKDIAGLSHPLYSLKISEMREYPPLAEPYDLFLHDEPDHRRRSRDVFWVQHAVQAYAANPVIARAMRQYRSDVTELWCPSTIEAPFPRGEITVLTFGMAHKLAGDALRERREYPTRRYHERLRELMEHSGRSFTILLSTGVHEGTPWDESLEESARVIQSIYGQHRVEALGYLSDAALSRELQQANAVALFFDPAVRANNTTFWAALETRHVVITNIDQDSPRSAADAAYDINTLTEWPRDWRRDVAYAPFQWTTLVSLIQEQPCVK